MVIIRNQSEEGIECITVLPTTQCSPVDHMIAIVSVILN